VARGLIHAKAPKESKHKRTSARCARQNFLGDFLLLAFWRENPIAKRAL
jgi:hypothetical protein